MQPHRISITIVEDWPRLKIIVEGEGGVGSETSNYDIAETKFQPLVLNALRRVLQSITNKRKDRLNNYVIPPR